MEGGLGFGVFGVLSGDFRIEALRCRPVALGAREMRSEELEPRVIRAAGKGAFEVLAGGCLIAERERVSRGQCQSLVVLFEAQGGFGEREGDDAVGLSGGGAFQQEFGCLGARVRRVALGVGRGCRQVEVVPGVLGC